MGDRLKVTEVLRTCCACPSQWEGKLADGRTFYARYRWGYLSFSVSPGPTDDIDEAVDGEQIMGFSTGRNWDGDMADEDLVRLTGQFIEWPKTPFTQGSNE